MNAEAATPQTDRSVDRRDRLVPLLLCLAVAFLLFRPLLWYDIQVMSGAEETTITTGQATWDFAQDLLCLVFCWVVLTFVVLGKVSAIAINTFREAVRNRILYIILFFALILMGCSGVIKELAIGAHDRIIVNLGLSAINLFGLLVAVLVGISLVYNELDKKTIYTIVSKPVARHQFLLGKFFGLLLTIYVIVGVMTLFFFIVMNYQALTTDEIIESLLFQENATGGYEVVAHAGWVRAQFVVVSICKAVGLGVANLFGFAYGEVTHKIMIVMAMTCLELMIVTAFAILYSSFSTPTLSAIFTVLTYLAGRLNEDILRFADRMVKTALKETGAASLADLSTWIHIKVWLAQVAAMIVPNLDSLNITAAVVHEQAVDIWRYPVLYAFCYTASLLMLAMLIFRKRNFK